MTPANHNKLMQLINSMVVKQDAIMRGPTKKQQVIAYTELVHDLINFSCVLDL